MGNPTNGATPAAPNRGQVAGATNVPSTLARRLSVGAKLSLVQLSLIVLVLAALVWVVDTTVARVIGTMDLDARARQTAGVIEEIAFFEDGLREEVSRLTRQFVAQHGGPLVSDERRRRRSGSEDVPTLSAGGVILNDDFTSVDRFTAATGGYATVFARRGDEFVRISTSLKKENGERALGTLLDHSSPAYAKALLGQAHVGRLVLFGRDMMTMYQPMQDDAGAVIGVWFVSLDFNARLHALRAKLEQMKAGKHGYFFVLDATPGPSFGTFVAHPSLTGRSGLELADEATGRKFIRDILANKRGRDAYRHLGEDRAVVYDYFETWGWVVGAASYARELTENTRVLRGWLISIGAIALAGLALALMLSVRRLVSKPLLEAVRVTRQIAAGDLGCAIPIESQDEVGQLMLSLREMVAGLGAVIEELNLVIRASAEGRLGVRGRPGEFAGVYADLVAGANALLDNLVQPLRFVAQNTDALAASSEQLTAVSRQLGSNANETSAQMQVVSRTAEQVSRTTQSIATATREMVSTINEIAKNAADSARVAGHAVDAAESADATITKLADSAVAIGKVIKVITSIAQQTNLLALNASIEAVRAGEAGKGFVVVANEVKALAKETAEATEDVGRSIESIQVDTRAAVEAIASIRGIINQIHDIASAIAGAVEQQSATTNQMGRSVADAAQGTDDIARNITKVTELAQSTSSGAGQTMTAASELARMAAELEGLLARFGLAEATVPTSSAARPRSAGQARAHAGPRGF